MAQTPRPLAVTMGEPAGIGGELTAMAWARRQAEDIPPFYAIDDPARLARCAEAAGLEVPIVEIAAPAEAMGHFSSALPVLPEPLAAPQPSGVAVAANAPGVIRSIERAVADARGGQAGGVVTNPINKRALAEGTGFAYPGHTEFLAALGGQGRTVMMLAGPELRVVPVTIHIGLSEVPALLSAELICETARITAAALRVDFGIARPRLAFAGLNPHAGEGGRMGREEIDLIEPALAILLGEGLDVSGPLPADTMFHAEAREGYDAALCMYHDQALIPLKTLDFHRGVNVTLGLPFIRTSPDHGTAFDLAGTSRANPTSFIEALRLAQSCAVRRAADIATQNVA